MSPYAVFVFFLTTAISSVAPKNTYKPKPNPCVTHAPMSASPLMIRVYISGSYTMKDLSGAQISGRDALLRSLNNVNYNKYQLADGVTPIITFNITINEYSGYYGAEVYMNVSDGYCKSNGKLICCCSAFKRFETTYVTPHKLYDDIASMFDGFIRGGWCTDCASPCNPY